MPEEGAGCAYEGREGGGGDVGGEDGVGAEEEEGYQVPFLTPLFGVAVRGGGGGGWGYWVRVVGPGDEFGYLGLGRVETVVEGDAHYEGQVVCPEGWLDVLEDRTVGRVEADGAEAFAGYGGGVGADRVGGKAGEAVGVGGVGYGPLGGVGTDWEPGAL